MHDFYPPGGGNGVVEYSDDEELEDVENLGELLADQSDLVGLLGIAVGQQDNILIGNMLALESSDDDSYLPSGGSEHSSDNDFLATSSSEDEMETSEAAKNPKEDDQPGSSAGNTRGVEKRVIDDYDPNDEDDEVVKKILTELKKPRSKPPNIFTEDYPTDISFHPERDILAVATILGDILIYKYTNEENTLLYTHEVHTKAISDIEFSTDGRILFSGGRDKSIKVTDFETGKFQRCWDGAHSDCIYTLTVVDENLLASGDEDGTVKLWDVREKDTKPIFSLKEVDDDITSIVTNNQKKLLVCTSADGYMTTLNISQRKQMVQSEQYEDEYLTCAGVFRNESKLVAGSTKGNFYTFNWGEFGYHNDAFSGPLSPISFMIPITERIAITAGEEGVIRAMHLVPGRVLGIVGQHSLAVESIDICNNGEFIASSSHDNDIRFWNIKYFEDFDGINYNEKPSKKAKTHNLPSSLKANRSDFFSDLA